MDRRARTVTDVEGRRIPLTNLGKVLYPDAGFTKADVVSYYTRVAPVLLPHLETRPATLLRSPDGPDGTSFFQKRVPRGAPEWVRSIEVPRSSRGQRAATLLAPTFGDLASLVWAANLAALELHVPLWRSVRPGEFGPFDQMVLDLDPGAPATIVECCRVAAWICERLPSLGHSDVLVKTSGAKGLQLYVPLEPARPWKEVREEARALARDVASGHPRAVVSNMRTDLRTGKVLIDWSQNVPTKTTVAAYSLRAGAWPTVSTPVTLEEVDACAASNDASLLRFLASDVLERVERLGDLFASGRPPRAARRGGSG